MSIKFTYVDDDYVNIYFGGWHATPNVIRNYKSFGLLKSKVYLGECGLGWWSHSWAFVCFGWKMI